MFSSSIIVRVFGAAFFGPVAFVADVDMFSPSNYLWYIVYVNRINKLGEDGD